MHVTSLKVQNEMSHVNHFSVNRPRFPRRRILQGTTERFYKVIHLLFNLFIGFHFLGSTVVNLLEGYCDHPKI